MQANAKSYDHEWLVYLCSICYKLKLSNYPKGGVDLHISDVAIGFLVDWSGKYS